MSLIRKAATMGMGGARPGAGRKPKIDARRPATFTLPPDQLAAIDALAGRDGISKSEALSRLIARALAANDAPEPATVVPPVEAIKPPAPFPVVVGDLLQVTEVADRVVFAVAVDVKRANPL
ncbi:MAG: ribbon-helix-helix protein, CopG family, partial [Candidatus Sericytochromatia bacterium]|nr:ribbon-helix-helix protein, CopG family [Candidatus Sericytochromatia bacterium]